MRSRSKVAEASGVCNWPPHLPPNAHREGYRTLGDWELIGESLLARRDPQSFHCLRNTRKANTSDLLPQRRNGYSHLGPRREFPSSIQLALYSESLRCSVHIRNVGNNLPFKTCPQRRHFHHDPFRMCSLACFVGTFVGPSIGLAAAN